MKRYLFLITFLLTLAGCSKIASSSDSEARYYIRYEAKFKSIINSRGANHVSVETADGKIMFYIGTSQSYSDIFGPFRAGFKAKIEQRTIDPTYSITNGVKIYVCRNSEPFVLVAYGNPDTEYTIEAY